MLYTKKAFIFFFAIMVTFGCTTTMLTTTESDSQKNNHRWPGYSFAEFTKGKDLYVNNCGRCHPLHKPAEFTEQAWINILPQMIEIAKLSNIEQELIFRYLITEKESVSNTEKNDQP